MNGTGASITSRGHLRSGVAVLLAAVCFSVTAMIPPPAHPFTFDSLARGEMTIEGEPGVALGAQSGGEDPGVTPLMRAVRDGESKEFKSLLKRGADINARDSYGWSALYYAVTRNDFNIVKALVEAGADVNAADDLGDTVLMAAARKGNALIVKYLIEKGADVNAKTKNGVTALTLMKNYGKAEMVEIIEAAGGVEGEQLLTLSRQGAQRADARPVPLNMPTPNYTVEASQNHVVGTVSVRVLVGAEGEVKKVRVLTGLPGGLSREAAIAVYKMKFKPALREGRAVEFWMPLEVEFNLKR
jgi:TonB family protein